MKAEELIKGKWYKISECNMYIKFLYFTKSKVVYNQCIIYKTSYFADKEDWCDKEWDFQEVSSEIQQYLPENHPDKIFIYPRNGI